MPVKAPAHIAGAMPIVFVYLSRGAYVTKGTYDCREGVMETVFAPALRVPTANIFAT